jgi:hypothetical protein
MKPPQPRSTILRTGANLGSDRFGAAADVKKFDPASLLALPTL